MLIAEVAQTMQKHSVSYAVVGGWAVALHGVARGTVDLDLVISLKKEAFIAAEKALQSIGLVSRLPLRAEQVFDFRKEYIENRNLIAWSFWDPQDPTRQVDIVITQNKDKIKSETIKVRGVGISIISKRDLIKMKRAAGRPQDIIDADALEEG